ncbi:AAEL006773-PA [Aedes aegypti]|uniref:AAEL006773-PA n=1 Tax=Aedes aegypti TaxID=7159 RepID=Q174U7_AEDAE|nr:AAEL006773-PA [Aedes aegypti]
MFVLVVDQTVHKILCDNTFSLSLLFVMDVKLSLSKKPKVHNSTFRFSNCYTCHSI